MLCTFTAAGDEILVMAAEAGVDGVEALRHSLILPHQHTVLQVPEMNPLHPEPRDIMNTNTHNAVKKKKKNTIHISSN